MTKTTINEEVENPLKKNKLAPIEYDKEPNEEDIQRLETWLKENGADLGYICIKRSVTCKFVICTNCIDCTNN
jgi:hypothetical protein